MYFKKTFKLWNASSSVLFMNYFIIGKCAII